MNTTTSKNKDSISWESVRNICIVKTLAKLGHIPSRTTEKEAWFLSPFRSETQASFSVCLQKNLWYDFGVGKGGTVIDLIMVIRSCSAYQAAQFLLQESIVPVFTRPAKKLPAKERIKIKAVRSIQHYALIEYIRFRKIPIDIARSYCKEVWYSFKGKEYFALGIANHVGGWELRNKYYKNSSSPKSYSFIKRASDRVLLTEGMFDFLSLAILDPELVAASDCIVLNSLSFVKDIKILFPDYKEVLLYLDNDSAGRKASRELLDRYAIATDKSSIYSNYTDLNEWLTHGKV